MMSAPVYDMCEVPRQLTPRTGDCTLSRCKSYLPSSSKLTAVSAASSPGSTRFRVLLFEVSGRQFERSIDGRGTLRRTTQSL
jgi:hypothetical protein